MACFIAKNVFASIEFSNKSYLFCCSSVNSVPYLIKEAICLGLGIAYLIASNILIGLLESNILFLLLSKKSIYQNPLSLS